jgi:NTE family protein
MPKHRRVALVLGSGGARGYAHIGVIQVLKERGYEIAAISGTSIGALVGGLEAAGALQDYADWVTSLSQRDVLRLVDVRPFGPGAIKLERVLARMSEMLGGACIEDLPVPYTAVATDLGARREVWFTSGPVDVAIRASIAIPGAITPIMVNGRLLVDGGLLNPLPIEPVMGVDADFTLAVSLSGWARTDFGLAPARESSQSDPPAEWLDRFMKSAAGIFENEWVASVLARFGGGRGHTEPDPPRFEEAPPGLGIPQVAGMALDTMGALITRYRLAALPPDLLIEVPGDAARGMDFHRAAELIELGRTLAAEALDEGFPDDAPAIALPDASPLGQPTPEAVTPGSVVAQPES